MESCTKKKKIREGWCVTECLCVDAGLLEREEKGRGGVFFFVFFCSRWAKGRDATRYGQQSNALLRKKHRDPISGWPEVLSPHTTVKREHDKKKSVRANLTGWCVKAELVERRASQCVENLSAKRNKKKKTIRVFTTGQQTDATYVHDGAEWEALVEAARVGSKRSTLVITRSAPFGGGREGEGGGGGSDRGVYWCQEWICIFTQLLLVLQLTKKNKKNQTGITLKKKT